MFQTPHGCGTILGEDPNTGGTLFKTLKTLAPFIMLVLLILAGLRWRDQQRNIAQTGEYYHAPADTTTTDTTGVSL